MAKTAQLEDFDEALYNITGDRDADGKENADTMKYLIATSEQPISAYHAGEWFSEPEKELPKKYAGIIYASCIFTDISPSRSIHVLSKRGRLPRQGNLGNLSGPSV